MEAKDIISCKPVPQEKLMDIVERLYTSETVSWSGGGKQPKIVTNSVSRAPASEEEKQEIYQRLAATHTEASKPPPPGSKTFESLNPPGYGQAMMPVIEGLDQRFAGQGSLPKGKIEEKVAELHTTMTKTAQARRDNPRHLLYPERTLLMNNVERIVEFQEKGSLVKQVVLQRREKWYN